MVSENRNWHLDDFIVKDYKPPTRVHIKTWMNIKDTTVIFSHGGPNQFITLLPGSERNDMGFTKQVSPSEFSENKLTT